MPLPPRLRAVVGADGFRRVAACQGRLATTRSGRCCQPATPACCVRPGGATLYLPPVDPGIPNPVSGSIEVQAGGAGDFSAWSTALQDAVGAGETEAVLQVTSNRWSVDHTYAVDAASVALQTLVNGCVAGFDVVEQFFPDGEPVGAPVGAFDGQYLVRDNLGNLTDTILLTGAPLYLQRVILSALHPAWTGSPATPGTPRWAIELVYQAAFVPFDVFALIPRVSLAFEFGDYCQVNAAQAKAIAVPSLTLPNYSPPLIGPWYVADSTAALDPATVVQPLAPTTAIGGGDSLRWQINAAASSRPTATNAFGALGQAAYSAAARILVAMQHASTGGTATRFTACPDFPPLVEPCNPTGANACCEGDADCGKIDALAPYRWRRVRQAVGSIEDMDPAGVVNTIPGWLASPPPVDDIVSMNSGTADCEISSALVGTSVGSAFAVDRLGTQRQLVLQGTVAEVNGAQVPSRALVEPIDSAVGKRWRISIIQPVRWRKTEALAADVIMGFVRIVGETPPILPGTPQTLLTITQAEFEWTDLPINPTTGYNGFALDAAVNPDPIDDISANVVGFAYLATTGVGGCLRAVHLVNELGPGAGGIMVDTTRFGWLTDSTTVATPQTRRKIRIRFNASAYFELLNIGGCPQAPVPIVGARPCRECAKDGGL